MSLTMSFLSVVSIIWIGAFKFSSLEHDVQDVKEGVSDIKGDIRRIDARLERMEEDIHNLDVRVNILEHRKP